MAGCNLVFMNFVGFVGLVLGKVNVMMVVNYFVLVVVVCVCE